MTEGNIDKLLKTIFDNLDKEIKNNKSLIELKNTLIDLIKKFNQSYYLSLNESIYNSDYYFQKIPEIIPIDSSEEELFSISSHAKNDVTFSLSKREDFYYSTLVTSKKIEESNELTEEELYETIYINIVISKSTTTWSITKVIVDEDNVYYSYEFEIYSYNKNNELIEIDNLEEQKDEYFSDFFGVPKEKSRKYRENFDKYIEKINEAKIKKEQRDIDEYYSSESKLFVPPFLMIEMSSYFIDEIPVDEELSEEEQENFDRELTEKIAKYIENEIIKRTGPLGLYTMSYNLYLNLIAYLTNPDMPLSTSGLLIRKMNNKYTAFYINFKKNIITIIEKALTKEEIKALYESNENNKNIFGVEDFFSETNTYGLK